MRVRSTADVAAAIRGRRQDYGLSQAQLAQRSGVSRKWISEFEMGKDTAEFALVIRVLETLGLGLNLSEDARTGATMSATSSMTAIATVVPSAGDLVDLDALLEEYRSE